MKHSDQLPTKDMVSLDDLKRAIDATDERHFEVTAGHNALYEMARAEAWRTAFEWREGWHDRIDHHSESSVEAAGFLIEGIEGMRLIRERLR